ncbi:uncharacterized protein [Ptychodera flava]|uniref:uncharacterized protein n=1 Tax=Ptychodera flava TaxID=63121 RepID=UPI00396A74B8
METFTSEQAKILRWAIEGKNIFFTGSAGTGKTTLVKKITRAVPRRVAVTAATGIAASQYSSASTIHSFTGIGTAKNSLPSILAYIQSNRDIYHRLNNTDTIIIDEISMISRHTLELINSVLQSVRENDELFGGIQIITCGDFKQLPPVPNKHDSGEYPFKSELWARTFSHSALLTHVFRQADREFVSILNDISNGKCSPHSMEILSHCRAPLDPKDFNLDFIPTMYTHNADVQHHNMTNLINHPGEIHTFKATDTGSRSVLNRNTMAEEKLHLKVGAPVMLIYNCTDKLKNGSTGTVIDFEDGLPIVLFPSANQTVKVERRTWKIDSHISGTDLSTRTQIPLKLGWAFSIHKAQGLSLNAAEIHCRNVFAPGHLYVAMSRVRSLRGLKLVGFTTSCLMPPPVEVSTFLDSLETGGNYNPSTNNRHDGHVPVPNNGEEDWGDDSEDEISHELPTTTEHQQTELLHVNTQEEPIDESDDDYFSSLPLHFQVKSFLTSLKDDSWFASQPLSTAYQVNIILDDLQEPGKLPRTHAFIENQWKIIYGILKAHSSGCPGEVGSHTRKSFTGHFEQLHSHITSDSVKRSFEDVCREPLTLNHIECMSTILLDINRLIIREISDIFRAQQQNVSDAEIAATLSESGMAKIRYVGGWATAKCLKKCQQYLSQNCSSLEHSVRLTLRKCFQKKKLIEGIIWSAQYVHEHSEYKDTLSVVDYRQYKQGGLVHISDRAQDFFVALEQQRVSLMTTANFNSHKSNLMSWVCSSLLKNISLQEQFSLIVDQTEELCNNSCSNAEVKSLVHEVYADIVHRYVNMGAGQFLRDQRCHMKLKKTEAHRRKIMQRDQKSNERNAKMDIETLKKDHSDGKCVTHAMIAAKIAENPKYFASRLYTKDEIKIIFGLYDVRYIQRFNKDKLNDILVHKIKSCQKMPRPDRLL